MTHPSSSQPSMRAEAHTEQSEGQPEPDPHSDGPDKVPPDLPHLLPGDPHQVEPPGPRSRQPSLTIMQDQALPPVEMIACLVIVTTRQLGEAYHSPMTLPNYNNHVTGVLMWKLMATK